MSQSQKSPHLRHISAKLQSAVAAIALLGLSAFLIQPIQNTAAETAALGRPTPSTYEDAIARAAAAVNNNDDWQQFYPEGFEQEFDDVAMMLVPAGCFTMGSSDEQIDYALTLFTGSGGASYYADEQPTTHVCFAEPFWIDKYEVTNAQFTQFNGIAANDSSWTESNRPRDNVLWAEARDFCALRDARLPTEAEWEYAARGPDSLIFPWGNEFSAENVIYADNADEAAEVGSRLAGVSWVGALDMSGNVWEWVSTLYESYPYPVDDNGYIIDDGREEVDSAEARVVRGGSWYATDDGVRAADRIAGNATARLYGGFRCVREVNE
jgi:formylglycine-generating enzyme required for sulfatase activity